MRAAPWAGLALRLALGLAAGAGPGRARSAGYVRREEGGRSGAGRLSLLVEPGGHTARYLEEPGAARSLLEGERTPVVLTPCDSYHREHGCGWTADYSCPGQPAGMRGPAKDDGSFGYACCCKNKLWQKPVPSPNRTLEEKAAGLARVVMALGRGKGEEVVGEARKVLKEAKSGKLDPKDLAKLEADSGYQGESAEAQGRNGAGLTEADQAQLNGGVDAEELGEAHSLQASASAMLGDIMPGSPEQAALFQGLRANGTVQWSGRGRPWPHGKASYCLGPSAQPPLEPDGVVLRLLNAAAAELTSALGGCIDLRYAGYATCPSGYSSCTCTEKPAIVVHRDSLGGGCWSTLGYLGRDSQQLNLGVGCESLGTTLHELGHALGMGHEQMRQDRDSYVRVLWQNVQQGREGQFATSEGYYSASGYDYESIMHLRYDAFSKAAGLATLQRLDGQPAELLGQRVGLSDGDVAQLVQLYKSEVPTCAGRVKSGEFGCINGLDDDGNDFCTGIADCASHLKVRLCCACRNPNEERPAIGGIEVQCYSGADCPQPERVGASPDWWMLSSHRRRSPSWRSLGNCTVANGQQYPISMECKAHPGCVHNFKPGEEDSPQCNGQINTEPCGPYPDLCDLWYSDASLSPPPPPAPARLPLQGSNRSYCQRNGTRGQGQLLTKVRGSLEACQRQCDATPGCQSFKRQLSDYDCWLFDKNLTQDDLASKQSEASITKSYYACDTEAQPAPPSDRGPRKGGSLGKDWRSRWLHLDQRWPEGLPQAPRSEKAP